MKARGSKGSIERPIRGVLAIAIAVVDNWAELFILFRITLTGSSLAISSMVAVAEASDVKTHQERRPVNVTG